MFSKSRELFQTLGKRGKFDAFKLPVDYMSCHPAILSAHVGPYLTCNAGLSKVGKSEFIGLTNYMYCTDQQWALRMRTRDISHRIVREDRGRHGVQCWKYDTFTNMDGAQLFSVFYGDMTRDEIYMASIHNGVLQPLNGHDLPVEHHLARILNIDKDKI